LQTHTHAHISSSRNDQSWIEMDGQPRYMNGWLAVIFIPAAATLA